MTSAANVAASRDDDPPSRAHVACESVAGKTRITHLRSQSPLRLIAPSRVGHAAWVYQSSYGGGFVAGDHIALDVDVAKEATLLLTTQASTKVYKGERTSRQSIHAKVADGGLLWMVPDPIVCYAGAAYTQRAKVELASRGSLVWLDWLTAGREAYGEMWAFRSFDSEVTIAREDALVVRDRMLLSTDDGPLAPRMQRFSVQAILWAVGPRAPDIRVPSGVQPGEKVFVASSRLSEDVHCIRFCATDVQTASIALQRLLGATDDALGDSLFSRKSFC
jgi:urease accessory protein